MYVNMYDSFVCQHKGVIYMKTSKNIKLNELFVFLALFYSYGNTTNVTTRHKTTV